MERSVGVSRERGVKKEESGTRCEQKRRCERPVVERHTHLYGQNEAQQGRKHADPTPDLNVVAGVHRAGGCAPALLAVNTLHGNSRIFAFTYAVVGRNLQRCPKVTAAKGVALTDSTDSFMRIAAVWISSFAPSPTISQPKMLCMPPSLPSHLAVVLPYRQSPARNVLESFRKRRIDGPSPQYLRRTC